MHPARLEATVFSPQMPQLPPFEVPDYEPPPAWPLVLLTPPKKGWTKITKKGIEWVLTPDSMDGHI